MESTFRGPLAPGYSDILDLTVNKQRREVLFLRPNRRRRRFRFGGCARRAGFGTTILKEFRGGQESVGGSASSRLAETMNRLPTTRPDAENESRQVARRLEEAFSRYQDELLGMLYYVVGNAEDARDALQDAFIKCWKHRDGLGGDREPSGVDIPHCPERRPRPARDGLASSPSTAGRGRKCVGRHRSETRRRGRAERTSGDPPSGHRATSARGAGSVPAAAGRPDDLRANRRDHQHSRWEPSRPECVCR